jgi:competence CoiA-like predicted nuclease
MKSDLAKILRALGSLRKTMTDGVQQIACPVCGQEAMVKRSGNKMESQCVGGRCYTMTIHD